MGWLKFLFNLTVSFFCVMGVFFPDNDFWYKGSLVALVVCVIYVFCHFFTAEGKFGAFIVDIVVPCLAGCFLGLVVFKVGIMGVILLSAASTIIIPIVATIFEL